MATPVLVALAVDAERFVPDISKLSARRLHP